eukprot:485679_1
MAPNMFNHSRSQSSMIRLIITLFISWYFRTTVPTAIQMSVGLLESGPYSDAPVQFIVQMPFDGRFIFDASATPFFQDITSISAVNSLGVSLPEAINNPILDVPNTLIEDFNVTLTAKSGTTGTYQVLFRPESANPTPGNLLCNVYILYNTFVCIPVAPTRDPSSPTKNPTTAPTNMPSSTPSSAPTHPSDEPTLSPSRAPFSAPTDNPTPLPTHGPSILPSSGPTAETSPSPSRSPSIEASTQDPTPASSLHPISAATSVPTIYPTTSLPTTKHPTIAPTGVPSNDPSPSSSLYATTTSTISLTNYTISISFHSCEQDDEIHDCDVNKTRITSHINTILIAYVDYDSKILSTDVMDNEVVIILSIAMDESHSLFSETISNTIENELEDEYGDIEVIVKETNNRDDTTPTKKDESWSVIVWIIIVVVSLGLVITMICCFHMERRKHVPNNQDEKVANNNEELSGNRAHKVNDDNKNQGEKAKLNVRRLPIYNAKLVLEGSAKVTRESNTDIENVPNNNILQEIEGDGENKVEMNDDNKIEMGYTYEGPQDKDDADCHSDVLKTVYL